MDTWTLPAAADRIYCSTLCVNKGHPHLDRIIPYLPVGFGAAATREGAWLSSSKGRDNNSSLRPVLSHPDREQNSGWTRGKREAQLSDGDDHRCAVQRFRLHLGQ
jgi:hypothetical protein